jgi:PAS domain S-box-containing protein
MSGSEVLAVITFYSGMVQPPNDELLTLLKATGDEIGLVAERQRAKAQVEAERSWLRAVIENAPIGTLLVEGAEGRRVVANRKAKELFGHTLPPEGGIEQYIGQIYLPDGWPRPRSDLATVRALGGETVISEEEIVRQPTGREVRVLVSAVPIVRDGKIVGAVVVYEDITRIHELMRLREEWTSVITHDLRQPVTVILAYAGLLARTAGNQLGPRHQEYVEHVEVAARNLNKLIGDLLDESRIETGRLTLECETVDLGNLVREVTARMATSMGEHPIRLDLPDALPPISVDPSRVEQVLSNLLSNAAKYSYPDTEVVVSVQRQRDAVEVTVTNQGAGIPPEEIPHLFTRFYRTAEAQEGQVRGLGLGLYIARGLIEAHHGRIWVDSVPDKTTAFHFTLPIPEVVEATRPS